MNDSGITPEERISKITDPTDWFRKTSNTRPAYKLPWARRPLFSVWHQVQPRLGSSHPTA